MNEDLVIICRIYNKMDREDRPGFVASVKASVTTKEFKQFLAATAGR